MKLAAAWVLLLCLAVTATRADTTYVQVATETHGSFFWYGHELQPPFDVEVGFSAAAAETVVYGVFVNRFPLVRPVKLAVATPNREDPEVQLMESVFRGVGRRLGPASTGRPYLEACARELEASALVDSAAVPSDRSIVVYWARNHEPNEITFTSPDFRRAPLLQASLERAQGLAASLQHDWIVLIGARGFASHVPPDQAEEIRSSIRGARRGLAGTGRPLNPLVRPYFERPLSVRALLEGEER
jgi:hypothetical protein